MKVVVEYVLLENLLINFIVLKTTCLIFKEKSKLLLLAAFLCACLTVALPALALSKTGSFLVQIGLTILSVCICFKFTTFKKFISVFCCQFLAAFIYGGACYFFEALFGISSTLIVLAVVVVVFMIVNVLCRKIYKKRAVENFCFQVEIETDGKKTKWKAFLDSGNFLFDGLTQTPVTLINFKVFASIFSDISLEDVLRRSEKLKKLKFAHYINLGTLSSSNKILVFQVDKLCIDGKALQKPMLGLCLQNFNSAFGTDILLHNSVANYA